MNEKSNMQSEEIAEKTYAMCSPESLDEDYIFVKENLKNILHSQACCCICLKGDKAWYYEMDFTHKSVDSVHNIENIILDVFGADIINCFLTENICQSCIKEITDIHRYVIKVKNTSKIIDSYVKQLNTELDTIHSIRLSNLEREFANTVIHLDRKVFAMPVDKSCPDCKEFPCLHGGYLSLYVGYNKKTKCLDCSQSYSLKEDLVQHANEAHLRHFPFHCDACGQVFPSKKQLKSHSETHHQIYKNKNECTKDEDLSIAVKDRSVLIETCKICGNVFCDQAALKQHIKLKHFQMKPYMRECSICHEQLFSLDSLNAHMNTHEYGQRHHCIICNKDFESRKCYKAHCNSWPHQRRVNPHKKFHHQCKSCDFSCPSIHVLENHRNVYHLKIKPYKCNQCDATFTTRIHLKHHLERHEGNKLRKYQCYHCPLILTTLSGLKRHLMRRHNDGTRPHECKICSKRYVSKNELQTHVLAQHSTDKAYECPLCSRTFGTVAATRCHVRKCHVKDRDLKEFLNEVANDKLVDLFRDRRRPHIEG